MLAVLVPILLIVRAFLVMLTMLVLALVLFAEHR